MDDESKKFSRDRKPAAGAGGKGRGGGEPRPRPGGPRPFGKPGFKPRPLEAGAAKPSFKPKPAFGEKRPFEARKSFRTDAAGTGRPRSPAAAHPVAETASGERIAKRLARAGIASRRDAEELIAAGRVSVNGVVLSSPATNVLATDAIMVDGTAIPPIERTRLFLFNKPAGLVTTNRDPEGRRTVFDALPKDLPRLMTVGRLDINTEGLLLLTNDGGLARVLELPATGWLRRYRVRVHGKVDEKALAGLRDGVAVDGVFYGAIEAALDREQGSNAWLTLGLREGKNREVKNILSSLGLDVTRLIRISYGPFQLGELAEGAVHELKGRTLRDQLGERLIEESGADFEAPVVKPFSNKPVAGDPPPRDAPERAALPNRKRDREDRREDALGRLQTSRPERGSFRSKDDKGPTGRQLSAAFTKPKGRKPREDDRPLEPQRGRSANVWMAAGARPLGRKKPADDAPGEDRAKQHRAGDKPHRSNGPGAPSDDMRRADGARPRGAKPAGPRSTRPNPAGPNTAGLNPHSKGKGPRKGGGADRRR